MPEYVHHVEHNYIIGHSHALYIIKSEYTLWLAAITKDATNTLLLVVVKYKDITLLLLFY